MKRDETRRVLYAADTLGFRASMVSALLCAATLSGPVLAASAGDSPAQNNTGLEEIVVTAEKRESTVQATAISLTALSAGDLAQENVTTIEDLVGKVPGISLRTSGPGQTEYEARGLSAGGGSAATVGFYIDETPIASSTIALNGRTVIDADLFDLSHTEVLRGPQGTLYGTGSEGGTIKLVTNPPKLGVFEGAADTTVSQTAGEGGTNGGGSLALNFPIGDKAAVRVVVTDKYISGFIDRIVTGPNAFPPPTVAAGSPGAPALCGFYCFRGNVANAPVEQVVKGANIERFGAARASLLVKPNDDLSITGTLMYQRIDSDGYNAYQQQPGTLAIYQPYNIQEPYYDSFKLASLKIEYNLGPATLTSATSYTARFVTQSEDSTEALQNVFNITHLVNGAYAANYIPGLYIENDPTSQFAEELRLTSNDAGPWKWVSGLFYSKLNSGYSTTNQNPLFANALSCGLASPANPVSGSCPASSVNPINSTARYPNATLPPYPSPQAANPNGIVFDDDNDEILKQAAIFGETTYNFTDALKLTGGIRFYYFQINYHANQRGFGTVSTNQDPTLLTQSANGNSTLPKLNLSYEPNKDLTLYGTLAKGSRPGGVNLPIPLPTAQQLAVTPTAVNCGAGAVSVNSQPIYTPDAVYSAEVGEKARFDDRRITVNTDFYYIRWAHIQQTLNLSCVFPYNTNAGNAISYGPEVEVAAEVASGLTLDLSGTYSTAVINQPSAAAIANGIVPGTRVLNVPRYTGNLSLNYQRPITDQLTGLLTVSATTVGSVRDVSFYPQVLSPYTLADARAGVTSGPWGAYLFGTNLTNRVVEQSINNTNFAWSTYAITRVSTNQPRTIGVDVQYKF